MSEGDVGQILRAVGQLEGKVDGVLSTLADMARKNEQRDAESGDHEIRIYSLEEWRKAAASRGRSWREWVGPAAGWVAALIEAIYLFGRVHGG